MNMRYKYKSILCKECKRRLMELELNVRPARLLSELDESSKYRRWLEAHPHPTEPVVKFGLVHLRWPEGGTRYE